jgi:hypothetical protein
VGPCGGPSQASQGRWRLECKGAVLDDVKRVKAHVFHVHGTSFRPKIILRL